MTEEPIGGREVEVPHVRVAELLGDELRDLSFELVAGSDRIDNRISNPRVQKPGLAFAGYLCYIKPGRVQIVGESEVGYLATLDPQLRAERCARIFELSIPVVVVTKGIVPPPEIQNECVRRSVPLFVTRALSSHAIKRISYFLEDHLVPSTRVHGVLLDVYGLGVLLVGGSGVGKSESALDLITRGHSLVADDRVTIKRYPSGNLVGFAEGPSKHLMELRGIGLVNVKDLFGLAAVRERKSVDLVIELEHWVEGRAYERLGLDESVHTILETPVPFIRMPVALGRNLSILVEIAARNHLLKQLGTHSAREFAQKMEDQLERNRRARATN